MRYRGFEITTCPDHGIERRDYATREMKLFDGLFCEIYPGNDDQYTDRLDYFSLAEGYDILNLSEHEVMHAICNYVDANITYLKEALSEATAKRRLDLLGRAVRVVGESRSGKELYDTLVHDIGLRDDEIVKIGFKSLVPYFDRERYAQTIADYMMDTGSDDRSQRTIHFPFHEINERFGTALPSDKEMMKRIISDLDPCIVANANITDGFDLRFYSIYCPTERNRAFSWEDDARSQSEIMQL